MEYITQALWGTRVSPGTVSNLNQNIYKRIDKCRNRPIEQEFAYLYLDAFVLKHTWADEIRNVSVLVAIGVDAEGFRQVLGVCEEDKEDKAGWSSFLGHLEKCGLKSVRLIISDACLGLVESMGDFFPSAKWQRCIVHFYRNVFTVVPKGEVKSVARMLEAIHASEDKLAAREKAETVIKSWRLRGCERLLRSFMKVLKRPSHTMISLMRIGDKFGLTTPSSAFCVKRAGGRVLGAFPVGNSALILVAVRLRYIVGTRWRTRRYLNTDLLKEMDTEEFAA